MSTESLVTAAKQGDSAAYASLVQPLLPSLRAYCYRMLANPEDAEDITQAVLERGLKQLGTLRAAGAFKGWMFRIAHHQCTDELRHRSRWQWDAQLDAEHYAKADPGRLDAVHATMQTPAFRYDYREHMSFCFTCVSRCLPPEQQSALVLGDVLSFTGPEAAEALEISQSAYRHRLRGARMAMVAHFDKLCALVNKEGVCYQCDVLREASPEDRRGPAVQSLSGDDSDAYQDRLRTMSQPETGGTAELHAHLLRLVGRRQRAMARPG